MRKYLTEIELNVKLSDCYLDMIPGTADSLLHLRLLADLVVQLLCQLHIVLRLVTEGS